ncbi:MAG: NusG domain II-containing protein [Clostridiales bacterium]|nr:NusG domain II-containing protein [Clostridiales bacterium]
MSKQKRNTIILIVALLILAGAGFLIQRYLLSRAPHVYAVVQYQGRIYERLDLSKDRELLLTDGEGNYNKIEVKDGQVSVTEANCADLICVYSYPLNEQGGVIACLPHSLVIYIESEEN